MSVTGGHWFYGKRQPFPSWKGVSPNQSTIHADDENHVFNTASEVTFV